MQVLVPEHVAKRMAARFKPVRPAASTAARLKDRMRDQVRMEGMSERTFEAYWHWSSGYIRFHGLRHPKERAQQGRRNRASPLLFAGLVVSPDGQPWHSDGCGHYRLGKGPKISAARLEGPVLEKLVEVLHDEATVRLVLDAMRAQATGGEVDGRRVAGLERRAQALDATITRTVDLAARMEDPAPVLRRVADMEHQRAQALAELDQLRSAKVRQTAAATFTAADVRALLRRLVAELQDATKENERRAEARQALGELLERIELDAGTRTARLLFAVRAGDTLATPRAADISPVRWETPPVLLARRKA